VKYEISAVLEAGAPGAGDGKEKIGRKELKELKGEEEF